MGVPLRQTLAVGWYVLKQRLKGTRRFPLVLMLEPLFRCNLACAGCGKIQHPEAILRKRLSPQECFHAAEECGAPVVSIAGGEPLIHPEIVQIVEGLVARRRFVYLCTNAILVARQLCRFRPSPYLTFSIHLDGLRQRHDELVCRDGVFDQAVTAIGRLRRAGFCVTINTTVFDCDDPRELRRFLDFARSLGVNGMTIAPGYAYAKAPDQQHFLRRSRTVALFRKVLDKARWPLNHSPQYLDFLMGKRHYQCTPWGNPTRNVFGWQRPCYLMSDGYAESFQQLLETTDWDRYGTGRDPRCADCMAHCGYEASAVLESLHSPVQGMRALAHSMRR